MTYYTFVIFLSMRVQTSCIKLFALLNHMISDPRRDLARSRCSIKFVERKNRFLAKFWRSSTALRTAYMPGGSKDTLNEHAFR